MNSLRQYFREEVTISGQHLKTAKFVTNEEKIEDLVVRMKKLQRKCSISKVNCNSKV